MPPATEPMVDVSVALTVMVPPAVTLEDAMLEVAHRYGVGDVGLGDVGDLVDRDRAGPGEPAVAGGCRDADRAGADQGRVAGLDGHGAR